MTKRKEKKLSNNIRKKFKILRSYLSEEILNNSNKYINGRVIQFIRLQYYIHVGWQNVHNNNKKIIKSMIQSISNHPNIFHQLNYWKINNKIFVFVFNEGMNNCTLKSYVTKMYDLARIYTPLE
jgi:hypothetical protein